jgi:hypothetical protein
MRNCTNIFTIYEEVLVIYDFAHDPSEFPNIQYEENFIFSLISVGRILS